ncbi:peptidylprolyl isomerase, partial [Salinicoccus roseus]|nr:peptidylprolyl isomerase [Salinicoccus roseus]
KKDILDGMISQRLFIQEVDNRDMSASEEEVDEIVGQLVEQNGFESEDELFAAFEEQGMAKEEVMSQIETESKIKKMIEEETGEIDPTEEELQAMYDQMTAQQEEAAEGEV